MSSSTLTAAGRSTPHESAHLHVSGEATYIDDIPEVAGTLHAALGTSDMAHARIVSMNLQAVRDSDGVIAVLTADDIPGENECGPIIHDDPVLADGLVQFIGQPVFAVYAQTYDQARRAARKAKIEYEELPAILDAVEGHRQQSYVVPPMRLARGDARATIANAPHSLDGKLDVGGQEHFYLEGQISYVLPTEDNGFRVHCSTQHPTEMQVLLCKLLKLRSHQVTVEMRRMGGGFGGKESQSALFCCIAALGASKLKRPVKLRLDRDDDMMISGKRHGFHYDYSVGFDDEGRILAASIELISQAGFSADLSQPVATRAVCHFDNAYYLDEVDIQAFCARTNTQSNTAFRGFGGPQGALAIEYIIDNIARQLGKDSLDIRKINFYGKQERNTTPYGQVVVDNVIHELVDELENSSEYNTRRKACHEFNKTSPVLKKGIALTPLKFGISFNVVHFNQAGALVHIYTDGSVLVNHGGTEMGQGLNTKVAQVVAGELGISIENVRSSAADTSKVANTSATAASTGTDLNGKAAEDAARKIRLRLAELVVNLYGAQGDEVVFANDYVTINEKQLPFTQVVLEAYQNRVQLWSDGFYATPDLHWDKESMTGRPFYYFAYGASTSEVLVDTLTGEWKLLRTDLLHDVGNAINPAIDIGQIEGAFIQGMGWLTSEELRWNDKGRLTTHAPSTYKIPASNDCPEHFTTRLFDNQNVEKSVLRSKAVGEPPLLLPFSVFFAIRDAIASLADYRVNPPLNAPATPEAILDAIEATQAQALEKGLPVSGLESS